MLSKILSKETCKNCKFCCSFKRQSLWETPLFSLQQKNLLQNKNADEIIELIIEKPLQKACKAIADDGKLYDSRNEKEIEIVASHVGNLMTIQEMAGVQICIARMNEELVEYWNAPCKAPYFKK